MLRISSHMKIQARNNKVNSFINMCNNLSITFIGSLNQRGGSDIGITVEGEGEPNEEECGPDEEEGDPDAIRALSEDDEESDSQFPNDITADKFSIVKEVKESFAYWQDKDEEPHNHRILHILRHSYGTFRNKYEVLLDA